MALPKKGEILQMDLIIYTTLALVDALLIFIWFKILKKYGG